VENEADVPPAGDVPGVPKKKGGKLWLTVIGALVIAGASSAAGATFGPSVKQKISPTHQKPATPGAEGDEATEDKSEEKPGEKAHIEQLESLVVDVHDEAGESHHVKVGIALEISEPVPEEEWKAEVVPKARDATIGYLRSLRYDEAASAAKFDTIRAELLLRLSKAIKKPKIRKIYFIDYVVQ